MSVTIKRSGPGIAGLQQQLANIQKAEVLVGIPASTSSRKGESITNAELMYIHSKGSPLRRIPARATLEPSIVANKDIITPHLGAAAEAVLQNDPWKAQQELERAGIVASNGAKKWFSKEFLAPNAPSTIAKKGSDTPLVNLGSLRRAVTYVVREK